ncbi:MAG: hypothetical protein IPM16_00845 [Chloroflexi bacterium]|nr:hypothetical protein [Chloroflexota bacterium]
MKKHLFLLVALLVFIMPFTAVAQEQAVVDRLQAYNLMLPQGYGVTSVENAVTFLSENPDTLLLDVREIAEYEAGHLENSFNVPIRTLSQNLALLPDLDAPILVICKGGARATLAATSLGILGYSNVKILAGGYDAWAGAELTTTLEPYVPEAATAPEIDGVIFEAVDTYLTTLPEGFGFVSPQNAVVELTSDTAPVLLDTRSLDEWNAGYIEGAQHIWINEFMMSRDEWPADLDTPIIIYCASGYRGSIATVIMRLMGYTKRMAGGGVPACRCTCGRTRRRSAADRLRRRIARIVQRGACRRSGDRARSRERPRTGRCALR